MKCEFDLHIHSDNSDGELNVSEIIKELKRNNIKLFSITDHDNIDSIHELEKENLTDLSYIKGIEISAILNNKYKMHILGYNIDENYQGIINIVEYIKNARRKPFL